MQTTNLAEKDEQPTRLVLLARQYAEQLEAGDKMLANETLTEINRLQGMADNSDSELFRQVGKLTRELHDSMSDFMQDSQMMSIMQEDMPDARQRLNHVIELTEQSAHDTMASIEHSTPLIDVLQSRAVELRQQLQAIVDRLKSGDGLDNGLGCLAEELDAYLMRVQTDLKKVSADFNDILLAQGYQDITGQIIQRVITLVQDVEHNLVGLLQLGIETGAGKQAKNSDDDSNSDRIGHGPTVPGSRQGERCESQDEVDDLLSTLGF